MLATGAYVVVFRILHVLAGIAWGGAVYLFVLYVQPSAAAAGPAGSRFMGELIGKRRMVDGILLLASVTIVAGGFLYWHDWQATGGFADWIESSFGLWMTIGAVSAILAFVIGLLVTRPNVGRMMALGSQIAAGGGEPTPEQGGQMRAIQGRLQAAARTSLALIAVAAFAMSTARYW